MYDKVLKNRFSDMSERQTLLEQILHHKLTCKRKIIKYSLTNLKVATLRYQIKERLQCLALSYNKSQELKIATANRVYSFIWYLRVAKYF